ncbi:MAG TPA: hypothetical protein VK550_21590 [Polyangiaceae bacterium]|nr:hypothetical protein [Polyangiaceae bacterium]
MRIVSSLVLVTLLTFSPGGRAETIATLVVERGAGAERCPDADALGTKIAQIRGRPALDSPVPYRVTFARTDDRLSATIRTEGGSSVRNLEHDGANCSALGHAVALTLALLMDSAVEPKKEVDPPPPPPAASPVATAVPRPPASSPRREMTMSLAVAGLAGVMRPASPALSFDVGMSFAPLRLSVGALWGLPQTLQIGPGNVHENLLGGFARICVPAWERSGLRFDACSGALAGAVTAEAEGVTRNERRTRPWIALPFEAALAGWSAPVGWEISLAGFVPLRRPDFTIDGLGTAYRSPPIGAILSLRMAGIFPW